MIALETINVGLNAFELRTEKKVAKRQLISYATMTAVAIVVSLANTNRIINKVQP